MTTDRRPPFDDACARFVSFLRQQGWPEEVCWISRDSVTGYRRRLWVRSPEGLLSDEQSRSFYETVRRGLTSLSITGVASLDGRTLACVQASNGEGGRNFDVSVGTSPFCVSSIESRLAWTYLRVLNRLRGEAPMFRGIAMTGDAEQSASPAERRARAGRVR